MKRSQLTLGLVQKSCETNRDNNLSHMIDGIREAAQRGAELVLLQELHNTPYFCQTEHIRKFDLAETIPGPSTETLGIIAKTLGVVIVCSLFEQRSAGLYHNTAVVIERDGHIAGRYRKMHIPDDPGYYEKFYFAPGDNTFRPIASSVGQLGILLCWDQWFPEAARLMTLAGADILLYPTAIGWDRSDSTDDKQQQLDAWLTIQRGHAIANGLSVAACNRVGYEPAPNKAGGIDFWGNSFIVGPLGEYLVHDKIGGNQVLVATIDLHKQTRVRQTWPFLRDRRIDAYADLNKRYRD